VSQYVKHANNYINGVIKGKIDACKWTRLACDRQRRDRERWRGKKGRYWWDATSANRICQFIENLPHVKGEWAKRSENIRLEPWQCFILTTTFGWKRTADNLRRFRTVYTEVPRKNAKSTISSGVGLFMLTADEEAGAEVYSVATTRDQAKITWLDAHAMAKKDKEFQDYHRVQPMAHSIVCLKYGSKFQALSADANSLDGLNTHCAIVDELHAHKTRMVYDVIETSTGSRAQPLIWNITTAGSNRAGICYEVRTYLTKVLDGVFEDDTLFGCIWSIDDNDNWTDPEVWKKANPNYGVSVYPDDIARLAKKAMEMPSATNNFLTKRLNVWVSADTAWMNMMKWDLCADVGLSVDDFKDEKCWIGLDLASKVDIAAKVKLFRKEIDGNTHYYAFGRYYLPESAAEDGRNSQYPGWAREGRLILTPGNVTDYEYIKEDLRADASMHEIVEVPYDPYQATQLSTEMLAEGCPMVEMRPVTLNFSEPMKELEKLVLQGRFHHDGCPVLTWMISNVVCHIDNKDNIYPKKERPENKIDGVVAIIMALGRAMVPVEAEVSIYETRPSVLAF